MRGSSTAAPVIRYVSAVSQYKPTPPCQPDVGLAGMKILLGLAATRGVMWACLLCLGLLSGQASGRIRPVLKKKAAPGEVADAKTGKNSTAKSPADDKAIHQRIDTTLKNHPFELDANAKLICEQTTVTAKPVWRGRDKLTFGFQLRNAGTADLQIQAKGG